MTLVAGFCLPACGAGDEAGAGTVAGPEDQSLSAAEREEVVTILGMRGLDVSTLKIPATGKWVIEEDILIDPRALLEEAKQNRDKGYWIGGSAVSSLNIWLRNSATNPVSATWVWAFVTGGADWNAKTDINFGVNNPPPGAKIVDISFGPVGGSCTYAAATFPGNGNPGAVTVNSTFNCPGDSPPCNVTSSEALPFDQKTKVAAHELGHALGFHHPGSGTHIAGTQLAASNYSSIMWQGCAPASSTDKIVVQLSTDDANSANAKY